MVETNFKHTEIGLIPYDWEVKTLRDCIEYIRTGLNPRIHFKLNTTDANGYYITVRELNGMDIVIDEQTDRINHQAVLRINERSKLKIGDVLFSGTGTIGRTALVKSNPTNWGIKEGIYAITPNRTRLDSIFLIYYLHTPDAIYSFSMMSTGSTIISVPMTKLEKFTFPLPPTLAEQEKIAGALSSIDTLIGALNEQIEKKRHIKQGTMQQLLTGKKRLAGFTGEWKNVRLGEICEFSKGKGLKKEYLTNSGRYKCILYGEIFTIYDGIIKSVVSRTDVYEGTPSKKGDVLMPGSTTTIGIDLVKAVALNEDNILLGGDVIILRTKEESTCADFLAYLISNVDRNKVADVTQGITIIHLHAKNLVDIAYSIPPIIAEQRAIAAVLSGMDTEIAALEQKRDKYIAIKSGMMQQLLTGKIRLI